MSVYCCTHMFCYQLSRETFGYTILYSAGDRSSSSIHSMYCGNLQADHHFHLLVSHFPVCNLLILFVPLYKTLDIFILMYNINLIKLH
jgi:hypothetical protein